MINVSKIQAKWGGLVGVRQPLNPDYQKVDATNQASRSGYFATDNEFVKVENIYDGQDYVGISDADFNTYLVQKQAESGLNVANRVFNDPDFLDRSLYYVNAMNKINTVTLPAGFVGFRIRVTIEKNIAISIPRVILDFEGTGDIKLLVFNTGKKDPIFTKDITIGAGEDNKEVILDWVLDNTDTTYKGDYYIGYLTDGLTVTPYARDYENSSIEYNYSGLFITKILAPNHNTETLFDLRNQQGITDITGLNFDITVFEDFTDLAINNESLFADAINTDLQINFLSTTIASLRSNRNERLSDANIGRLLAEIEGTTEDSGVKLVGLRTQLSRSIGLIRKKIERIRKGYFAEGLTVDTLV